MVDASLLVYADVTYVGHKYEDAAREEEGKQLELLARKKGVRVVRDSLRELYTLNKDSKGVFFWIQTQSRKS